MTKEINSYVVYNMRGFSLKVTKSESVSKKIVIENNQPYKYSNHEFIDSLFINDEFNKIIFYMLPGISALEHITLIEHELEKVCFNIIAYTEVETHQPICELESIVDEKGEKVNIYTKDSMVLNDQLQMIKKIESNDFYKKIVNNEVLIPNYQAQYKELFYILHSPHKVMQFIGLYDIMAELINSPISQSKVHVFFGKNKDRYPFIKFIKSRKGTSNKEDSFTYLRNTIAHSKQAGIDEFLATAQTITKDDISNILQVINDLICGNVKTI